MNIWQQFFWGGGPLVWAVLLPLSVLTVSLIVQFFLLIRRTCLLPEFIARRVRELVREQRLDQAREYLKEQTSLLARTLYIGLSHANDPLAVQDQAMLEILEQDTTALLRRIEWLNIIGNVAPMIGLFGTVWGMINAFHEIVQAGGQPEPADLAGGISMALVTTWWGMIVAIPALASYGVLRNRLDAAAAETALTAENILRDLSADVEIPR